jgi:sulfite reductase (NADPH) hemoprotein beta-component
MSAPVQKSKEKVALQAVTGNRLRDGAVVFRTAHDTWSTRLTDAQTASDETSAAQLLAAAERDAAQAIVVGPYLFAVGDKGGQLQAVTLRERIRANGPTVVEAGTDAGIESDRSFVTGASAGLAAMPYL